MLLRQITPARPVSASRRIFLASAATLAEATLPSNWPAGHSVLAVLADSRSWPDSEATEWAADFVRAGAAYVCCWGPDCARLEARFDLAFVGIELASGRELPILMTTSHVGEPLLEAVWFAAITAYPVEEYATDCHSLVVLVIGNDAWATEAAAYLEAGAPLLDEA